MNRPPAHDDPDPIRAVRRWYFALWLLLGLAPIPLAAADGSGAALWGSLAVPAVLALSWAVVAAFPANPLVRPHAFLCLLVGGLGVLSALRGAGAAGYVATLPNFWFYAATGRQAMVFGGAAAAATVLGDVVHSGGDLRLTDGNVLVTLLACAVALVLGRLVPRLLEHSERRTARLAAELGDAQREVALAHQRQGAAEERERMAREIHDTLAQGFASIIVLAEAARGDLGTDPGRAAQQLLSIERTARENFTEARVLVGSVPQSGLVPGAVADTLRRTLSRFTEETAISADAELDEVTCDQQTRIALLRCTQESLANIRKHAGASSVGVVLTRSDWGVELEITDDGRGFDVTRARGFGLDGMRARLAELGGELTVTSSPDAGTRVHAVLPAGPDPEPATGPGAVAGPEAATTTEATTGPEAMARPEAVHDGLPTGGVK
jgi:signal transduction histidine kinase